VFEETPTGGPDRTIRSLSRACRARRLGAAIALLTVSAVTLPSAASAADFVRRFDFQPKGLTPAAGFTADAGAAFSSTAGFGWVRQDSITGTPVPLSAVLNGRERSQVSDARLGSFMHMQYTGPTSVGTLIPAAWQIKVPNGTYHVKVGVGDGSYLNSTHQINVEGKPVISGFVPTSATRFKEAAAGVTVTDGTLTVDAKGGKNTKLGYVQIVRAVDPALYGINAMGVFGGDPAFVAKHTQAMAASGMRVVRRALDWKTTEPTAPTATGHQYRWGWFDTMVRQLAQAGLEFQPVLSQAPTWAAASPTKQLSAPSKARMGDYKAWVTALTKRYGRNGAFWAANPTLRKVPITRYEIWNEENGSWNWGTTVNSPEDYADLFMTSRSAIRAIDPAAKVIVGGLAPSQSGIWPTEFLRRMYARRPDLAGNVDGIGFHPYHYTAAQVKELIKPFRATVDQYAGAAVPIAITETGWSTYDTSESNRAAFIRELAQDLPRSDCNISELYLHTWVSREARSSVKEDFYGLANSDSTVKPAGAAFSGAMKLMRGMAASPPLTGTVRVCH
jgi:hypothetical protein